MLPQLNFSQLADKVENSSYFVNNLKHNNNADCMKSTEYDKKFPVIPSRITSKELYLPQDPDEKAMWYMVLTPREIKGIAGPFHLSDIQRMYKSTEIKNSTLFWREGDNDWQQLMYHETLRPKVIPLPVLPPRVGSYNAELAIFDPIIDSLTSELVTDAQMLNVFDITKTCFQCGSMAVANIPNQIGEIPDLYKCRVEIGTTSETAEVLPGFLFVGSSSAANMRGLKKLGITYVINATTELKSPPTNIPFYRCIDASMIENPINDFTTEDTLAIINLFDRVYDLIERHRLFPELAVKSDPVPKSYRGPTDNIGIPIKTSQDLKVFRRPIGEEKSVFPPRVLIWSKLGINRSSVLAASYLIKHYGISLDIALKIIQNNRTAMKISDAYLKVLSSWSQKYSLGTLLCYDCYHFYDDQANKNTSSSVDKSLTSDQDVSHKLKNLSYLLENQISLHSDDIQVKSEIQKIVKVEDYIISIKSQQIHDTGGTMQYKLSGIIDLELTGRHLSDVMLAKLIGFLSESNLIRGIRTLKLQSNFICHLALKELLLAYYPEGRTENGEGYNFDEYQYVTDVDNDFELTYLDLSNNRLDEFGVNYLCCFLKQCNTITYLDISNNNLDDYMCADIFSAITRPFEDFESNDSIGGGFDGKVSYGHSSSEETMYVHNHSITYLNIGYNSLGEDSAEALTKMVKNNAVLRTLNIELSSQIPPPKFRNVFNGIRLYNSVLEELSLADTPLTVKTVEYLSHIMESKHTNLSKLNLSNCNMKHQHIKALLKYVLNSSKLSTLDISGNKITDAAADALVEIIVGDNSPLLPFVQPPLNYLDLTSCGLLSDGCLKVLTALSIRNKRVMQYINLSSNIIGSSDSIYKIISQCSITNLKLNICDLGSNGGKKLFSVLCNSTDPLPTSLKSLSISGNNIADTAIVSLCSMLESNRILKYLDLGFNLLSNLNEELLRKAYEVTSSSDTDKKVNSLMINFVGNKFEDPYMIGTPGLARSKSNFLFGTQSNPEDVRNGGYSHISHISRGHFLARKELDNQYKLIHPNSVLNKIE